MVCRVSLTAKTLPPGTQLKQLRASVLGQRIDGRTRGFAHRQREGWFGKGVSGGGPEFDFPFENGFDP